MSAVYFTSQFLGGDFSCDPPCESPVEVRCFNLFVGCRQDFKFFSEMDGIFRKQLKVDDSDSDLLVPEEPEEHGAEAELGRGEILH